MTSDNDCSDEPTIFSATITPYRSLGNVGFLVLMLVIGGVSFAAGVAFLMLGAWPVFGFFGLDVLLIYWAFRVNYRAARAYEQVRVTGGALTARKVRHPGQRARGTAVRWRNGPSARCGPGSTSRCIRNTGSKSCSWSRMAASSPSPIFSARTKRRHLRRLSRPPSARPGAAPRARSCPDGSAHPEGRGRNRVATGPGHG